MYFLSRTTYGVSVLIRFHIINVVFILKFSFINTCNLRTDSYRFFFLILVPVNEKQHFGDITLLR
jgi:hypothetical protein